MKSKQRKEEVFTLLSKLLFDHDVPSDIFYLPNSKDNQKKIHVEQYREIDESKREFLIKNSVELLKVIFGN